MRGMVNQQFSLYEITHRVQQILDEGFQDRFWVFAEISELNENRTGHCYLELVEKDSEGNQPKAKVRATVWSGIYRVLKPFFETSTGIKFASGLKVLVLCQINFHPVYGFSLNIQDIDPSFTLGDIEQKRRETIERLIADGVFGMNKELEMPLLPKRIAIVSSPTAAGFQDFTNQIESNPFGYTFTYKIFSAVVQGEKAEESIIDAFSRIHLEIDNWDLVAIIRGGGSQTDLSCFDGYELASNIAQFPIPVITGIGHEKDISIADMVAHTRLKTPTAAAEFILNLFTEAESVVVSLKDQIVDMLKTIINDEKYSLARIQNRIIPNVLKETGSKKIELQKLVHITRDNSLRYLSNNYHDLKTQSQVFHTSFQRKIDAEKQRLGINNLMVAKTLRLTFGLASKKLEIFEVGLNSLKHENILKRGFSITYFNGKVLTATNDLKPFDEIETMLRDGRILSSVKNLSKKQNC